jgi:hypothetical protein
MFYTFGTLSAIGFVVFICCIKETQGLTKEDIEQLYVPYSLQKVASPSLIQDDLFDEDYRPSFRKQRSPTNHSSTRT